VAREIWGKRVIAAGWLGSGSREFSY